MYSGGWYGRQDNVSFAVLFLLPSPISHDLSERRLFSPLSLSSRIVCELSLLILLAFGLPHICLSAMLPGFGM